MRLSSLIKALRAIALLHQVIEAQGLESASYGAMRLRRLGGEGLEGLSVSSALNAAWAVLIHRRDTGRAAAGRGGQWQAFRYPFGHRRGPGPAKGAGCVFRTVSRAAPAGSGLQPTRTSMRRGWACSALGMRTRSTPWFSSATMRVGSSSLLSVKRRR